VKMTVVHTHRYYYKYRKAIHQLEQRILKKLNVYHSY